MTNSPTAALAAAAAEVPVLLDDVLLLLGLEVDDELPEARGAWSGHDMEQAGCHR